MNSTYHQWKNRAQKSNIYIPWTSKDLERFERRCKKIMLNKKKETDISLIVIFFLVLIIGIMLGYGWCLYHFG